MSPRVSQQAETSVSHWIVHLRHYQRLHDDIVWGKPHKNLPYPPEYACPFIWLLGGDSEWASQLCEPPPNHNHLCLIIKAIQTILENSPLFRPHELLAVASVTVQSSRRSAPSGWFSKKVSPPLLVPEYMNRLCICGR